MEAIIFLVLKIAAVTILLLVASGIIRRVYVYWLFKKNGLKIYYNQLLLGMFFPLCECGHPSWYGDFVKSNGKSKWLIWVLKNPMPYCHKCLGEMSYPCRCGELILVFDKAFIVGKFDGAGTAEIICGQCRTKNEDIISHGIWNPPLLEISYEQIAPLSAPVADYNLESRPTQLH